MTDVVLLSNIREFPTQQIKRKPHEKMSNVAKEKEAEADQNVSSQEKMSSVAKTERAELHDDDTLFSQPEGTHLGECPLCFLPMPIDNRKSFFKTCCSETICEGCVYADLMSNIHDEIDEMKTRRCPFCREPHNDEENDKRMMKRVKANDPAAMRRMGTARYDEGDYEGAIEYWTKAAELGDIDVHYRLGFMYYEGEGVEKDAEKMVYHWEKAAIGGHPIARHNLGNIEEGNGNMERAVKHLIIAANLGFEESMKSLWGHYSQGNITKEDLDTTLRAHQAAINGMKSEQRDFADYMRQRL
jgi:tetratricopeptide (TPR) repeat protein